MSELVATGRAAIHDYRLKRGNGAGAVAVLILFGFVKFSERFSKFRKQKDRIVTKAFGTARLPYDDAGTAPFRLRDHFTVSRERQRAYKTRVTFSAAVFQLIKQLADAIRVGCVPPGITRRINSRPPAKRNDLKTGVIGDNRERDQPGILRRF